MLNIFFLVGPQRFALLSDVSFLFPLIFLQVPVYKEPTLTIPGIPGIVQHEILNNRRLILTKVIMMPGYLCTWKYCPQVLVFRQLLANSIVHKYSS